MQVILDTSFIVSCLMKRIEFLDKLSELGFHVLVPREVLEELKDLKKNDKTTMREREMIAIALELLSSRKIKKTRLGHKNVDQGLIQKGVEGIYIATLDRGIKNKIPNKIVISAAQNSLLIERA
ncbi:MAG: PIN domain-containing protein [Nanoarchaeota archaeon]